jgi:inorganic pyrophosphatase
MAENLVAVVEIPKGSSNKYEWEVVKVDGWYPREEALESIERAKKRFAERQSER